MKILLLLINAGFLAFRRKQWFWGDWGNTVAATRLSAIL